MTRVFGLLFEDERDGILAIKPSRPFFGCEGDEQHVDVISGTIDCDLLPTPNGITYLVGFKRLGDSRRTNFTTRWRIPDRIELDMTPNVAKPAANTARSQTASVYERVQLKRVADELNDKLDENVNLTAELNKAQARVQQLEQELHSFRRSTDLVLTDRDSTIAYLSNQNTPAIKTVYLEKPVPHAALYDRIKRLEQENIRLLELNAESYKSDVDLYQLQLSKARNSPQSLPVEAQSSPQKRLLRKLPGK